MTGFGEARIQDDRWSVGVEVRTVNNRHLKLNAKISDPYGALEPDFERLVRETIRRGTVQLSIRVDRPKRPRTTGSTGWRSRAIAPDGRDSWARCPRRWPACSAYPAWSRSESRPSRTLTRTGRRWPPWSPRRLAQAPEGRAEEGRAMAEELIILGKGRGPIHLEKIASPRGPEVVASYQKRLTERVQSLLQGQGATVEPKDLVREVAIFAERADIAEEVVRLRAHFAQYVEVIDEPESSGRKLEFVVQEMGRETNTIGSKANDVEISRGVVEIKGSWRRSAS